MQYLKYSIRILALATMTTMGIHTFAHPMVPPLKKTEYIDLVITPIQLQPANMKSQQAIPHTLNTNAVPVFGMKDNLEKKTETTIDWIKSFWTNKNKRVATGMAAGASLLLLLQNAIHHHDTKAHSTPPTSTEKVELKDEVDVPVVTVTPAVAPVVMPDQK